MADAALQRKNMVESQVRPSDVTDRRIMRAMLDVPRDVFVPENKRVLAYSDADIALDGAGSRALLAPRTLAKLVQLAGPDANDHVLVVGAGCGYSAAVLSKLAASVVALECDADLATQARASLDATGCTNVEVATGPLTDGLPDQGAYDAIVFDGAVGVAPESFFAQLKDGGRIVAIVADGAMGEAMVWLKQGGVVSESPGFDAAARLLPGFEAGQAFVF